MKYLTKDNKGDVEGVIFYNVFDLMKCRKFSLINIDQKSFNFIQEGFVNKEDWVDNHKKTDNPPDFYSDKLMVEVMLVNDNEHLGNNGKIINPVKKRSNEIMNELKNSGILDNFSDNIIFLTNPTLPELSQDEFHNYNYYTSSFNRIVGDHIKKIPKYRKNHPDKKLIFLIEDESAAYIKLPVCRNLVNTQANDYLPLSSIPHRWWLDKNLLKVFKDADLDYVLWHAPHKYIRMADEHKEREFVWHTNELIVINPREDVSHTEQYDPKMMICSER